MYCSSRAQYTGAAVHPSAATTHAYRALVQELVQPLIQGPGRQQLRPLQALCRTQLLKLRAAHGGRRIPLRPLRLLLAPLLVDLAGLLDHRRNGAAANVDVIKSARDV